MNSLQKSVRTTIIPGSPGVPADPGQPALPARWSQTTQQVCSYQIDDAAMLAAGWTRSFVPNDNYGGSTYVWRPPAYSVGAPVIYKYICRNETVTVYLPAQAYRPPSAGKPGVPSQTIIDKLIGWNARGHSSKSFAGYGQAKFSVPRSSIGVVVGLNSRPIASGYTDIQYAFYFEHGVVKIMESGAVIADLGTYDESAVFGVRRLFGSIIYMIDGEEVASTEILDSLPVYLDAALFSGGDSVLDSSIGPLTGAAASLPPMRGFAGDVDLTGGVGVLPALQGVAREGNRGIGILPKMQGFASAGALAVGLSDLPALQGSASSGELAPGYAIGSAIVCVLTGAGNVLTGEIGTGEASLPAMRGFAAEGPFAEGIAALPALSGFAFAGEGNNNATVFSLGWADNTMSAMPEIYVTMNSTGQITSVFAATVAHAGSLLSVATVATPLSLQAIIEAALMSVVTGSTISPLSDESQSVWVVNADTQASTRYENYGYNSFAKINGRYYGAKSDGIYSLDGGDDDGAPIQAMIAFGKQDFGVSELKSVPNCYIGMSANRKLYLKVTVEGKSYVYAARSFDEDMKVQRFDLGKGIRANYIEFELYNEDGGDFELKSVEFTPVALSRRI